MDETPTKRRWFQFSLRTLFIFVTVIGCALGWYGMKLRNWLHQVPAINAIRNLNGDVQEYDYRGMARSVLIACHDAAPADLENFFSKIDELSELEELVIFHLPVTDTNLERLRSLHNLKWLLLTGTKVTEAGVESLRKWLPNCKIQVD